MTLSTTCGLTFLQNRRRTLQTGIAFANVTHEQACGFLVFSEHAGDGNVEVDLIVDIVHASHTDILEHGIGVQLETFLSDLSDPFWSAAMRRVGVEGAVEEREQHMWERKLTIRPQCPRRLPSHIHRLARVVADK